MDCSKKRAFDSKKEAKARLREIKITVALSDSPKSRRPTRVYHCPECSKWHLTSITIEKWIGVASPEAKKTARYEKEADYWLRRTNSKKLNKKRHGNYSKTGRRKINVRA